MPDLPTLAARAAEAAKHQRIAHEAWGLLQELRIDAGRPAHDALHNAKGALRSTIHLLASDAEAARDAVNDELRRQGSLDEHAEAADDA